MTCIKSLRPVISNNLPILSDTPKIYNSLSFWFKAFNVPTNKPNPVDNTTDKSNQNKGDNSQGNDTPVETPVETPTEPPKDGSTENPNP